MKKTLLVTAMAIALTLSTMAAAFADGRWDNQVTGGGEFFTGATYFDLAVSSRTDDGTTKGMFQYTRDDLALHGVVDCLYIDEYTGNIAMSGDVKVQEGDSGVDYVSVEISADGQEVRVHEVAPGATNCGYSGSYGATLVEGNFNLK